MRRHHPGSRLVGLHLFSTQLVMVESTPAFSGFGSQMHCNTDLSEDAIKRMLTRMMRTGKKVRISELDVPQASYLALHAYLLEKSGLDKKQ